MGGPNLEVFKFGMYIMFPIGWMYYFGTNLDNKFTVEGFWPTKEQLNSVPTEREDIMAEVAKIKERAARRKERRAREKEELAAQGLLPDGAEEEDSLAGVKLPMRKRYPAVSDNASSGSGAVGGPLDQMGANLGRAVEREGRGWMDWLRGR